MSSQVEIPSGARQAASEACPAQLVLSNTCCRRYFPSSATFRGIVKLSKFFQMALVEGALVRNHFFLMLRKIAVCKVPAKQHAWAVEILIRGRSLCCVGRRHPRSFFSVLMPVVWGNTTPSCAQGRHKPASIATTLSVTCRKTLNLLCRRQGKSLCPFMSAFPASKVAAV